MEYTDPLFVAVASILGATLWAGLRMTGSKILGLILVLFSLGGLWAWFQPTTPALLWGGEVVILGLCALYGWYIYEPTKEPAKEPAKRLPAKRLEPTESIPTTQVSSAHQSVGIAGDYNTVFYNQAPNVQSETTRELNNTLSTYYNEGRALLKEYEVSLNVSGVKAKKWSQKVVRCLKNNLKDDSYAIQFEKDKDDSQQEREIEESKLALKGIPRENRKIHRYLSTRLYQLYEIMEELRKQK